MPDIADAIRSEAATSTRPGQYERLMSLAKFVEKMEADDGIHRRMYLDAALRWQALVDSVFRRLADGDVLGLLEDVGNSANSNDYVDDELIELFGKAKDRWAVTTDA